MNDLAKKLRTATGAFEEEYKNTLNDATDIDDNVYALLYDLGASIKHLMDGVISAVDSQ